MTPYNVHIHVHVRSLHCICSVVSIGWGGGSTRAAPGGVAAPLRLVYPFDGVCFWGEGDRGQTTGVLAPGEGAHD